MKRKAAVVLLLGLLPALAGLLAACAGQPAEPGKPAEAAAPPPLELAFSEDWYQLAAGNGPFEIRDNALYGRGRRYYEQLGSTLPAEALSIDDANVYNVLISPDAVHVTAATATETLTAAYLDSHGDLYGLGDNMDGLMREEMTHEQRLNSYNYLVTEPKLLMADVLYASLGGGHILVIKTDHSLWAWGLNANGQLGDGSQGAERPYGATADIAPYSAEPLHIMDDVVYALAFGYSSAALQKDGSLWTWGDNSYGQIGNGSRGYGMPTISDNIVPEPYRLLGDVTMVWTDGGEANLYAADRWGNDWAWGEDYGSEPRLLAMAAAGP